MIIPSDHKEQSFAHGMIDDVKYASCQTEHGTHSDPEEDIAHLTYARIGQEAASHRFGLWP